MGDNLLNDLMQPQHGVAPRHGTAFAFIAFNLVEILFRPGKGAMALTILKPGLTNSVRIQRMQRHLLAPRRIGKLKLFDHQGKNAVKQAIRSFGDLAFHHEFGQYRQRLVRNRAVKIGFRQNTRPGHQRNV